VRAPTHISFATLIYLGILTSTGVALSFLNWLTLAIASLLPDIDTGASMIGRVFSYLSRRIERRFGHRTLTHSVPFIAIMVVAASPLLLLERDLYFCLLLGYASHPLLDSCTVTGVRLLYPLSMARCVFPMDVLHPFRYRIQTGTRQEVVLAVLFALGCIPAFFVAHQGYERFVRVTQGTIESAVRDYNEFSRTHVVWVECLGHNLLTKERLEGVFRVGGALDKQTLLIHAPDGKLHTLGKEFYAEYTAERASCTRGEPAKTRVESFDMAGSVLGDLPVEGPGEVHLFGTLLLEEEPGIGEGSSRFAPLSGRGKELKLSYATPYDIENAGIGGITASSGTLVMRRITIASDSATSGARGAPDRRITVRIGREDRIELLKEQGDTVAGGEVLALLTPLATLQDEGARLTRAVALRGEEKRKRLLELDREISHLLAEIRADSLELAQTERMERKGFVGRLSVPQLRGKLESARERLTPLLAARGLAEKKGESERLDLERKIASLQARLKLAGKRKEIRSPLGGVVRTLERRERSGVISLTIVIDPE
jgi:inner membrane protein